MLIEARRNDVQSEVLAIVSGMSIRTCARTERGATRGSRPLPSAVHRPHQRLPVAAQPLGLPAAEAGRTRLERIPASVPQRAPQLRARARVDGCASAELRSLGGERGSGEARGDGGRGRGSRNHVPLMAGSDPSRPHKSGHGSHVSGHGSVSTDQGDGPEGHAAGDAIHRAILSGLLSHLGILDPRTMAQAKDRKAPGDTRPHKGEYIGARGARFASSGSGLLKKKRPRRSWPPSSSRPLACSPGRSPPSTRLWAEELAPDLVRRSLSEPHWSKDAGSAAAYEKVTLFGFELVGRRRVQLAASTGRSRASCSCATRWSRASGTPSVLDKRLTAFLRRNRSSAACSRRSRSASAAATS